VTDQHNMQLDFKAAERNELQVSSALNPLTSTRKVIDQTMMLKVRESWSRSSEYGLHTFAIQIFRC